MRAQPSCPRCGSNLHPPGLWSSAWSCHEHGPVPPVQPVVQPTEPALVESVRQLQTALAPTSGAAKRVARLSAAYARRLGGSEHAERFWLLLPPREEGGITTVADVDEPLPARAG